MRRNKILYEAPEAETFVVRIEGNILSDNVQIGGVEPRDEYDEIELP